MGVKLLRSVVQYTESYRALLIQAQVQKLRQRVRYISDRHSDMTGNISLVIYIIPI